MFIWNLANNAEIDLDYQIFIVMISWIGGIHIVVVIYVKDSYT